LNMPIKLHLRTPLKADGHFKRSLVTKSTTLIGIELSAAGLGLLVSTIPENFLLCYNSENV
jgi:hypothetical protein